MPCKCYTPQEILDWLRTQDQWCSKKLNRINRILRNFYLSTMWLAENIVYEPVPQWLHTIVTTFPMYHILGFFWNWCKDDCYMELSNKCCGEWTKMLKMYQTNIEPKVGQYNIVCENSLRVNTPSWFSGYLVYSKWPNELTSLSQDICIDWMMLSWLEYYMEMFYDNVEWDINRMQINKARYEEWLKLIKESQEQWIFEVVNWEANLKR